MIIKYYNSKEKLIKETKLVNNPAVIPQLNWLITIKSISYRVSDIEINYDTGFIIVLIKEL